MNASLLCLALAGTPSLPLSAEENTATTDLLRQMAERPLSQIHIASDIGTVANMRTEYFPDLALIPADAEAFLTIPGNPATPAPTSTSKQNNTLPSTTHIITP